MEYPELDVYPVLANDVCPNQRLNDVGIEYRFLNDELVAINFVAINDRNLVMKIDINELYETKLSKF